jgi:hypothetical protein
MGAVGGMVCNANFLPANPVILQQNASRSVIYAMNFNVRIAFWGCVAIWSLAGTAFGQEPMVVHEWGTFTSFQDETGRAIGGINTDDEPVPDFVHRAATLIQRSTDAGKGILPNNADVTMRLETPVLYFHLPSGGSPRTVDVNVAFHGGWLTEYFPNADADEPGLIRNSGVGHLSADTVGTLTLRGVRVGTTAGGPQTTDPVWTSPRDVTSDGLTVGSESEKFLFYRGVAHLDSPLRVVTDSSGQYLSIFNEPIAGHGDMRPSADEAVWLISVTQAGDCGLRRLKISTDRSPMASTPLQFSPSEYTSPESLRKTISDAIVAHGLDRDEADALLNTWQQSYFAPGLRVLFLVNPDWTDRVLPLRISEPAKITRVMVGRIELVTPFHRQLIRELESASPPDATVNLTDGYPAYWQLGRFRNALLLDEQTQHPNPALTRFLQQYSIRLSPTP